MKRDSCTWIFKQLNGLLCSLHCLVLEEGVAIIGKFMPGLGSGGLTWGVLPVRASTYKTL